jgi:endonuclease-3 related protein
VALSKEKQVRDFYRTLFRAWGRQHWWPARSRMEVIIGAFLTQNTAWSNVEKAMAQLRRARVLSPAGIRSVPLAELEQLIRSAGYFRQKARRLKNFVDYLDQRYGGSLDRMFARPTAELREELLALNGVGPETADSILLYAGNHPVFVVDAYTRRILDRHCLLPLNASYEDIRTLIEGALGQPEFVAECETSASSKSARNPQLAIGNSLNPARNSELTTRNSLETGNSKLETGPRGSCHAPSRMSLARRSATAQVFNEMHGLIVGVGKNFCLKSKPVCDECPLKAFLPAHGARTTSAPAPHSRPRRVTEGPGAKAPQGHTLVAQGASPGKTFKKKS